jgi:hypothetical protein
MRLRRMTLAELQVDDEDGVRHVGVYADLRRVLAASGYRFAVCEPGHRDAFWGRALFLNLTFWGGESDVLVDRHVPADVVAHVAWHHLAARAVGAAGAEALFLGEAIASAFDLYLVGRLVGHVDASGFLDTQVPAMAEAAQDAGLDEDEFERMLQGVAREPERAFEDLRALLFDAACALVEVQDLDEASTRLSALGDRRFYALLHHFELSNWILHARARCPGRLGRDEAVRAVDAALRAAPDAMAWLEREWVAPALAGAQR